jgi:hypothetical protein
MPTTLYVAIYVFIGLSLLSKEKFKILYIEPSDIRESFIFKAQMCEVVIVSQSYNHCEVQPQSILCSLPVIH